MQLNKIRDPVFVDAKAGDLHRRKPHRRREDHQVLAFVVTRDSYIHDVVVTCDDIGRTRFVYCGEAARL